MSLSTMKKIPLILLAILGLFLLTRLYRIFDVPPSLYWDEASIGYNAYSIITTANDEWGEFMPLHFRAFGEFKLPVYIYMVSIFELLFGLNELSIRLPAVFFSLGSIVVTFLLIRRLTQNETTALLSAFFLSVSQWFFVFTRTGYEATAGLFFYLLGIYFLLQKKPIFVLVSTASFILSLYSYNSFRIIVVPTLIAAYLFLVKVSKGYLVERRGVLLVSWFILLISILPVIRLFVADDGGARFRAVSIIPASSENLLITLAKNYATHFKPDFILSGDQNMRSQIPGFGQLTIAELLLVIWGVIFILKSKESGLYLLLFLALVGLLPSSLTKEAPHSLRSIAAAPFFSAITSFGTMFLKEKMGKRGDLFIVAVVLLTLLLFSGYYRSFVVSYSSLSASYWQYGYKKIFADYANFFASFDNVVISDTQGQPYIFALVYLRYNPNQFRAEVKYNPIDHWGVSVVRSFNKFIFMPIQEDKLPLGKNLVFASPEEKLKDKEIKATITNPDGTVASYVYEYSR